MGRVNYRAGADVGGTFTDLVAMDEAGRVIVAKAPTTPVDQSDGVMDAIAKAGIDLTQVDFFSHGTTVGVNAVIENRGAKVAVITTEGFRDAWSCGAGSGSSTTRTTCTTCRWTCRRTMWEATILSSGGRSASRSPSGSISAGNVLKPLDEPVVWQIAGELRRQDVEAVGHLLPVLVHEPGARAAHGRDPAGECFPGCVFRSPARSCPSSASTSD